MTGHPSEQLHEEVAFIAYHFHWPYDQIMSLDHRERHRWVAEISRIHLRLTEEPGGGQTRGSGYA
ncbi:hypothetical protein ADK86_03285 [Streptomyces sp. NRRL F-5755]|uniref:DUF6760 family protein n=1 Tax=Streptomyces sp. NRRL F-5755 TaxID=1519475 RepID=UPI0006AE561C|nr:DUF6760 family protein [Streptomyces sp. NRRL F-5755]KOU08796.1 hypothetical protein ADK86_03285 [Streptomyces sp. NRRL F-5755]